MGEVLVKKKRFDFLDLERNRIKYLIMESKTKINHIIDKMSNYVYLKNTDIMGIYKIGRTSQSNPSVRSGVRDKTCRCMFKSYDNVKLENILKKKFKEQFALVMGHEYFKGDINRMCELFVEESTKFNVLYAKNMYNEIGINTLSVKKLELENKESKIFENSLRTSIDKFKYISKNFTDAYDFYDYFNDMINNLCLKDVIHKDPSNNFMKIIDSIGELEYMKRPIFNLTKSGNYAIKIKNGWIYNKETVNIHFYRVVQRFKYKIRKLFNQTEKKINESHDINQIFEKDMIEDTKYYNRYYNTYEDPKENLLFLLLNVRITCMTSKCFIEENEKFMIKSLRSRKEKLYFDENKYIQK